ncbi:bromodomain-containing protein [Trifolium repens]|nr:bromodomain-containing protein [Trifolium repens]
MKKVISLEAIRGIPKLKIVEGKVCGECQIGKQVRMSHPMLEHQTTSKILELLHMDLMGPMQVESLGGKRYVLVVVDDYSRYTWVNFIREKSDAFEVFKELCIQIQREKGSNVVRIRSDHGREFENSKFDEFCAAEGIKHEYSSPITPQQNGIVERKNRTIQESARVMLHAKNIPYHFWAEAMNTACYVHNRVTLRKGTTSTLYELWKNRKPTVKHFHIFGSECFILADREPRRKLDPKSDKGFFLGYSTNSRAYRVYNTKTQVVMESVNVVVKDSSDKENEGVDQGTPVRENAPAISTASKQKTPKKMKIAATVSAEDAVAKAPGILSTQKKKAGRSIPQNIPDVPMDNVSFHFSNSAAKWKFVYHRRLALERELSDEALECKEVMDLILQAGLMKTVSGIGRCYEKLVKEFIVNIGEDCDNKLNKEYHQVFVRGKCVQFSPAVINAYLGRREYGYPGFEPTNNQVCKTITANQVKVWPLKGKVPSVMLSIKYAILNRIGAVNWVPTSHTSTIATGLAKFIYAIGTGANVDYGSLIFDQIVEHGKSWAIKLAVSFPTLICEIILDQHPNILVPEDVPCKRESPMTLSYKLFEGKHAADITVPTKKATPAENVASTSMTRKTMILTMEATVRALDEQKSELEKVIAALKKEEAEEEGLMAENAGDDVAGDGTDDAVGDAAGTNVDDEGGDTEELEVSDSSASL